VKTQRKIIITPDHGIMYTVANPKTVSSSTNAILILKFYCIGTFTSRVLCTTWAYSISGHGMGLHKEGVQRRGVHGADMHDVGLHWHGHAQLKKYN
jgi:hypothetical protein